jgi:hypothetical protein
MDIRRIFAAILLCFPAVFLYLGFAWWGDVREARRAVNWPVAPGWVTASQVARDQNKDGTLSYSVLVSYEYKVSGNLYKSVGVRSVGTSDTVETQSDADAILQRYPVGPVDVHYDAEKPARALLEVGDANTKKLDAIYLAAKLFAVTLVLGSWCWWSAARSERRHEKTGSLTQ